MIFDYIAYYIDKEFFLQIAKSLKCVVNTAVVGLRCNVKRSVACESYNSINHWKNQPNLTNI